MVALLNSRKKRVGRQFLDYERDRRVVLDKYESSFGSSFHKTRQNKQERKYRFAL